MKVTQTIRIALLLPTVWTASELLAQSPPSTLPNAPAMQSLLVASAQSAPVVIPPVPAATDGTPTLLTRQDAEKIALANNPRIHIS